MTFQTEEPARPAWLSTDKAAALVGCDPRTLRRMVAEGRLPAARIGRRGVLRLDPRDLDALKRPGDLRRRP